MELWWMMVVVAGVSGAGRRIQVEQRLGPGRRKVSPWTLADPLLEAPQNELTFTLKGDRIKKVILFASVNESFTRWKDAQKKITLKCIRGEGLERECRGSGVVLVAGDVVHYGVRALVAKPKRWMQLTGQRWGPYSPGGVVSPDCSSLNGEVTNGCKEVTFEVPDSPPSSFVGRGNPERGFYKHTETRSSDWTPVDAAQLDAWLDQGFTLIYRNMILDSFVNSDISAEVLQLIRDDFQTIKLKGIKVILRFCYSIDVTNRDDAPPAQLLTHIDQLAPILQEYGGVVAVMHAGFIGVWGEWYYTNNYGDEGVVTEEDWANRAQVVTSLLQALPSSREIQLRTPNFKRTIVGRSTAITDGEAHSNTQVGRIGHHNDCFLASDTDFGTYLDKQDEYPYLQQETKYLTMGGETCNPNPPRSNCPTAEKELSELHFTYLNANYHPAVLEGWQDQGCYDQIRASLGYRVAVTRARVPDALPQGGTLHMVLAVQNIGYAAPINYRPAQVLLRHASSGTEIASDLAYDLRDWLPGIHEMNFTIAVPVSAPAGDYQVLLRLPDGDAGLQDIPEYNMVVENTDHDGRLNYLTSLLVTTN